MVRPIDLSDSVNKAEVVQRLQQNQKIQPEAAQHFQKTFAEKLTDQAKAPNPVPKDDQVVLHVDERKEKTGKERDDDEYPHHEAGQKEPDDKQDRDKRDNDSDEDVPPHHIDFTF